MIDRDVDAHVPAEGAETVHATPLVGSNGEAVGTLAVATSRRELAGLQQPVDGHGGDPELGRDLRDGQEPGPFVRLPGY